MSTRSEKRSLFAIIITYISPLEEVDHVIEAHRAYLRRFYEQGNLLTSGALTPRTGGFILARAESKAHIESFVANDPYALKGVARYEIIEFQPSSFAPGFEQFLSK